MVAIRINGEESSIRGDGLPRVTDLIELVRTSIDPEHMIISVQINGGDLEDETWNTPVTLIANATLDIATDTPENYVNARLLDSPGVVQACYVQFRDARKTFQEGRQQDANRKLVLAVGTLQAFFDWYSNLVQLASQTKRGMLSLDKQIEGIKEICGRICQQQLTNSWWAIGETLQKELEPRLDELETHCRKIVREMGQ